MKLLMALSGALFVFYVLLHMYGNLKIFGGVAAFDEYALHLRTILMPILPFGGFLWIFRVLLVVALVAHAYSAFYLWSRANGARTTRYVAKQAAQATIRSRMMRWGGVALLLFLVWHLLQFTILKINVGTRLCRRQRRQARHLELPGLVGRPHLRAGARRPRHAPVARRVERLADPRLDQQRQVAPHRQGHWPPSSRW